MRQAGVLPQCAGNLREEMYGERLTQIEREREKERERERKKENDAGRVVETDRAPRLKGKRGMD